MGQKDCSMSLIKKPCAKGVFDCRRCLTKMKNAGKVWEIDVGSISFPFYGTIPAFRTKLHYDKEGFLVFANTPDGVVVSEIKCVNGIGGRVFLDTDPTEIVFFKTFPNSLLESILQVKTAIYFETIWRLWLRFERVYFGDIILGGDLPGRRVIGDAHYISDQDNCFITEPAEFTLHSDNGAQNYIDPDYDGPELEIPEYSFPETVSFQHVENNGFITQ